MIAAAPRDRWLDSSLFEDGPGDLDVDEESVAMMASWSVPFFWLLRCCSSGPLASSALPLPSAKSEGFFTDLFSAWRNSCAVIMPLTAPVGGASSDLDSMSMAMSVTEAFLVEPLILDFGRNNLDVGSKGWGGQGRRKESFDVINHRHEMSLQLDQGSNRLSGP